MWSGANLVDLEEIMLRSMSHFFLSASIPPRFGLQKLAYTYIPTPNVSPSLVSQVLLCQHLAGLQLRQEAAQGTNLLPRSHVQLEAAVYLISLFVLLAPQAFYPRHMPEHAGGEEIYEER